MRIGKRMLAGLIIVMVSFLITACGKEEKDASEGLSNQAAEERETTGEKETTEEKETTGEKETAEERETTEGTEATESDSSSEGEEGSEASAEFKVPVQEDFAPAEGLSGKYIDFDNRAFAYNGKVFKLGESTLKELIDGGIPFDQNELNNKGNNVNPNHETSRYSVEINDYVLMQFRFVNITGESITEEECLLSYVRFSYVFLPQPDYEAGMNAEITESIFDAADIVCFSFPATLTKEQLLENSSEGAAQDEYNHVDYKISSEVYLGSSGYSFTFDQNTNQMKEVTISWLP